jgi:hypothetical protein
VLPCVPPVLGTFVTKKAAERRALPKATFLSVLRTSGGNVSRSAEAAGVSRLRAYQWRYEDPEFAIAWDDQLERIDSLEEDSP